jgi:ribonuclease VapC
VTIVLDASALLAALLGEPGADRVDAAMTGAILTTVNLAEVVGYYADHGARPAEISAMLAALPVVPVAPDEETAIAAGLLRPLTRSAGMSLGDRFCLAHAKRLGGVALTADRAWSDIAAIVGVEIELIR